MNTAGQALKGLLPSVCMEIRVKVLGFCRKFPSIKKKISE